MANNGVVVLPGQATGALESAPTGFVEVVVNSSTKKLASVDDAGVVTDYGTTVPSPHAASHVNGADDIQSATASQKGLATPTQIAKLDGIEVGADVTDAFNVAGSGAEMVANKNAANGYAGLSSGKLAGSQQTYGATSDTACQGNDARLSDARTPTAHKTNHEPGGSDAMAVDAVAGTGSLRTLGTAATAACAGNDSRLSDARTPTAHATSHQSGGGDGIKLDDLATPDDNTDLNASTTRHGLLPKLNNSATQYLNGQGSWSTPAGGGSSYPMQKFWADQLDYPNNADWAVNAMAGISVCSNNAALLNRRFDDATNEGVGFSDKVPTGATNITIKIASRAETAPGGSRVVKLRLYTRNIPNNGAVAAWSSAYAMTDIAIPTNEYWQYDEQTIALSALGITAGNLTQFEFVRNSADAGDTLVGDWDLLFLSVEYS